MRRVVFNQKGGVGKSTITCNLAAVGARAGRRTLVIDLDQQGNTSRYLLGATADAEHADAPGAAGFFEESLRFSVRERGAVELVALAEIADFDRGLEHRRQTRSANFSRRLAKRP